MNDIYCAIATQDPIWESKDGRICKYYEFGYIVFDKNLEYFEGPFDKFLAANKSKEQMDKGNYDMQSKSIESWIEEVIDRKIKNHCLASKGYVQAAIMEKMSPANVSYLSEDNKMESVKDFKIGQVIHVDCDLYKFIDNRAFKNGKSFNEVKMEIFNTLKMDINNER